MHQRILQLKAEQKKQREDQLLDRQTRNLEDLENNFNEEFKNFNTDWDDRMNKYRESCKDSEQQLKAKQENEVETTRKQLEETTPLIPKHSSEILNLKRIQETLVKNKEYIEAHAIQQQMIDLEESQKKTWGTDRKAQIDLAIASLERKQANEMAGFKQKAKNGFDELKKQRAQEMESLLKRYQNLKKEMQNSHRLEKNRFDGKHTTGSGIFKSEVAGSKSLFSPRNTFAARPGSASRMTRTISEGNF